MMARLKDGDRAAFEPVFQAVQPALVALARRALPDPLDAEDAAQEALLKVFARASDYDPSRDALSWILAIGAYECLTVRKRRLRRREAPLEDAVGLAGADPGPEDRAIERDLFAAAEAVVGELGPADRQAILASIEAAPRPPLAAATFRKRLERAIGRARGLWRVRHDQ